MTKRSMVNPTTAMPDAPMSGLANLMAMKGRDNDSMLVHLSPHEVSSLNKISGNTMTINPDTGLPEGRSRFLEAGLQALLGIGVGIATGGASIPIQMAAQAAAGYGGARLTGKDHDEALTSGLVSGATAGLFGGAGTDAAKTAVTAGTKAIPGQAIMQGGKEIGMRGAQDAVASTLNQAGYDALNQGIKGGNLADIAGTLASDSRSYSEMAKRAFQDKGIQALADPAVLVGGAGQLGKQGLQNAAVEQMRADANYVPPTPEVAEEIDIYSTPFTQTAMGPYNQQQIADNFISGGTGPYGMNYFNQAYGQEGGQVRNMYEGGLTQFQSIMGNPALQLQNPNPPLTYGFGGALGRALGIGGGGNEMMVSYNGGPKGASPGGKGQIIRTLVDKVKQQELLQQQPEQKMALGGDLGKYIPSVAIINSLMGKLGSDKKNVSPTTTNNYYGTGPDGQPILMDGPPKQIHMGNPMPMAGGGQLDPMMVEQPAPQDTKSYDVLASIGSNPMQQMAGGGAIGKVKDWARDLKEKFLGSDLMEPLHKASNKMGIMKDEQYAEIQGYAGGGLPQVGQGQASIMQALQPMLQVANERAQQPAQMSGGGEIVAGLRAIADNRAFEGRVKGEGDGMSDSIPFNIEGEQPALLARDEYVIPADIVAMVGNGSSDAGADHIDQAIIDIRETKYGRQQQPRETEGLGGLLG